MENYYHRIPHKLDREEIRAILVDLVEQKKVSWPYYKQVLASSLRFFYRHVVRHGEVVEDVRGPLSRKKRLPVVLSVQEVARFFKAIPLPEAPHDLDVGLRRRFADRRSGANAALVDIDRQRKVIRVQQGKGEEATATRFLSPALLEILDRYCWAARPEDLAVHHPLEGPADLRQHGPGGLRSSSEGCGDRQTDFTPHATAQLCHTSAGSGD